MTPAHIQQKLEELRLIHQYRELKHYGQGIDFFSNDYLGLAKNFAQETSSSLHYGATGSRLISGNHELYEKLESFLREWMGQEVLVYGSGYMANVGVLSSIPTRHDTILYDSLCHASLKDGIRLSLAKSYPFPHNDYEKLEKLIRNSSGDVYVVVESVYSMDGDSPDAYALKALIQRYGIYLIVDEAHSFGIQGPEGKGWIYENHLEKDLFLGIYPLGKAAGAYGAFVTAQPPTLQFLVNFSRTFIYSTALPPVVIHSIHQNLLKLRQASAQRAQIMEHASHFGNQWIVPFMVPGNENCLQKAEQLQKQGFLVKAILSPTVPKGKERIRIVLHSFNTASEVCRLRALLDTIHQAD